MAGQVGYYTVKKADANFKVGEVVYIVDFAGENAITGFSDKAKPVGTKIPLSSLSFIGIDYTSPDTLITGSKASTSEPQINKPAEMKLPNWAKWTLIGIGGVLLIVSIILIIKATKTN